MKDQKEPIIEAIWALMTVYGITLPELEHFRGRQIYEDMVAEDPDEAAWIAENVKPRKKIEVKYAEKEVK